MPKKIRRYEISGGFFKTLEKSQAVWEFQGGNLTSSAGLGWFI